jgi:DNA invertase Pin-like site-specific DNA recombinase
MNVVIWAQVSSREQREGHSIDAQLRANRERAERAGWRLVREFVVAEHRLRVIPLLLLKQKPPSKWAAL